MLQLTKNQNYDILKEILPGDVNHELKQLS